MTVMSRITKAEGASGPLLGLAGAASVRTPCGERRVENVRPGDLIVTRDNGLQAVRFVWQRTITAADIAADPALAPIRIKPRAIGPMMPTRDILVAASHRILVPGYRLAHLPDGQACLLSARQIADASDDAFVDRGVAEITFHNLVFDQQQVFCANGLPVESYLPTNAALNELDSTVSRDLADLLDNLPERPMPQKRYIEADAGSAPPEFV